MTDHATILIPDISGYTEFLSKTELDHSSHIINELLIDLDKRAGWIPGVKGGIGEIPVDRVGARLRCIFDDMTIEIIPQKSEIGNNEIQYVESCYEAGMGLKYFIDCRLMAKGEKLTRLVIRIGTESGQELAPEVAAMLWQNFRGYINNFKVFCEAGGK